MSGIFQFLLARTEADLASVPTIMAFSVLLRQIISNVPLMALCQSLVNPFQQVLMALAAGSIVAVNHFILGAASNVIIIQNA